MSEINVVTVEGGDALDTLRSEWQELFAASQAPPFLSWEWMTTWHKWFGGSKHLLLLCARKDGRLIGLLPLCEEKKQLSSLTPPIKRLSFLGETHGGSDYLDILALPKSKQEVALAFVEHLEQARAFDLLELDAVRVESDTLKLLAQRFGNRRGFNYRIIPQFICPQMILEDCWEETLKHIHRADYFKRSLRRLEKLESFEFHVVTECNQVHQAFERFIHLHEDRWQDRGGSSLTDSPRLKDFLLEAFDELACSGMLRFEEIWIEGECRASLVGIESGKSFYFYLSGFDHEWSKYSLGFTLLGLSIREANRRGLTHYDFLRGSESYKFDLANCVCLTVGVQISSNSWAARLFLAQTHAKEFLRAVAPDWLKLPVRQAQQNKKLTLQNGWHKPPEKVKGPLVDKISFFVLKAAVASELFFDLFNLDDIFL